MKTLREYIKEVEANKVAIGHFNISNIEGFWAIVRAAETLDLPVIIGVSEGERDFIGVTQVAALVQSYREETGRPVFLNADHTYTFEGVQKAVDAGFDAVIIDGAKLPLEENIALAKQCAEYAKSKNPEILVEGELGYIGASSKILDAIPDGASQGAENLTSPAEAEQFVKETGVDLLSPAVGNIHGMLRDQANPKLDIERISLLRQAAGIPLVLHGASGNLEEEVKAAIQAGMPIVHINTELRVAYRDALKLALQEHPDEVAPYKIMKEAVTAMQKVVERKLRVFNGLE